jgi:hypothetical protein
VNHLHISFDFAEPTNAADYGVLFDVIEDVHSLLCRLSFEVQRIHRASPGEIVGVTFAQAALALTRIFSFGAQIKDLRLSAVKVQEARLDLSRKEIELDDFKRRMKPRGAGLGCRERRSSGPPSGRRRFARTALPTRESIFPRTFDPSRGRQGKRIRE